MMQIGITFKLPIQIFKEDKWWIGWCPALDVSSSGDTPEDARAHLGEALSLFIESCIERGVLEEVLRDCGFTPAIPENISPAGETTEPEGDTIEVPLHLLAKSTGFNQCHHA